MAKEYHYCEECNKKTEIWGTSRREAERKLKWWQEKNPLCNECVGKKEYAAASAKAAELDLLPLKGTPGQIEFAQRIRVPRLAKLLEMTEAGSLSPSYFVSYGYGSTKRDNELELVETALPYLCAITSADWWIDCRTDELQRLISAAHAVMEEARKPENDPALQKAVDFETTIRPEKPVSELIATIEVKASREILLIGYPEKDDKFNEAVKAFNPEWKSSTKQWRFRLQAEQFNSLAAEICLHLLGCDFVIRVPDTPLREMILAGNVAKSDGRMIDYAGADHFRVDWRRIDGDFYDEVRKVAGSKWDKENRTVLVPIGAADELRDFAKTHGFPLTDLASQACAAFDEYRHAGMVSAGKKRAKGQVAEPLLDRAAFPDNIKIDPSLLDA